MIEARETTMSRTLAVSQTPGSIFGYFHFVLNSMRDVEGFLSTDWDIED